MKSKFALALLVSAAVIAAMATDASAAGRGGGGGGGHSGGGGGFHGGGGGGFHMGGGGGFHAMGGGGLRIGGGGFHAGGSSLHANAFRSGNFGALRAGSVRGYAGRNFGAGAFSHQAMPHRAYSGFVPGRGFVGRNAGVGTLGHQNAQFGTNRAFVGRAAGVGAGAALGAAAVTHAQFAHNQFAAHNFHGLHNFNQTGFNRNAFGDPGHWNRWGGHFWGAGWHRWGRGWGGWAGPVFWPYLYGDVFSFAFWPYDYYDPFWVYGPDFVLVSIFAPGPYFGPDYGYAPDYGYVPGPSDYSGGGQVYYGGAPAGRLDVTKEDRQALAETNAAAMESCNGLAPGVSDLPIEQIKKTVRPTGDQLAVLDELKAAALKAQETVKASCPTAVPLTPVARLDAAEARLDTMIRAVQIVRDPLQQFYDALNDEQRHSFESMGSSGGGKAAAGGNLAALCNQQSGDVAKPPIERVEQVVQPTGQQQQDAFNALKQASHDAAEQLQVSCPKEVPQTPVARLDAVNTRLEAMVEAMKTIRPKLQDFYTSLSDEQKAKFNIMGPAQSASSGAQQEN